MITMNSVLPGVYKVVVGTPEIHTPMRYKAFPELAYGGEYPPPFSIDDLSWQVDRRGLTLSLPLDAQVFGFGLQLKGFNHTRLKRIMRSNADAPSPIGESHAPVPFYVTTRNVGVLVDTARNVTFYCGQMKRKGESIHAGAEAACSPMAPPGSYQAYIEKDKTRMFIEVPYASGVTLYLFAAGSMMEAVEKYNMFSGGGAEIPSWGLGIWYRIYSKATAEEWASFGEKFKAQNLPVSVIGLEPGWQSHSYSCTYVWDEDRAKNHSQAVDRLHAMGYKVNLWEHAFVHPDSPIYTALYPYSAENEVWGGLVPDLSLPEAREIFAAHQKNLGVDCFKLDECDGSDYNGNWSFPDSTRFPSGMDGEQMHNLMGTFYAQTMMAVNPGACHSIRGAHAFAAPYPFILYSDLYGHEDYIRGVVNAGFSGLLWAPEVRDATCLKDFIRRMQTALFSPQMLINAWYLKNPPWEQIDMEKNLRDEPMPERDQAMAIVRGLFEDRVRLLPYLQEQFALYVKTGRPVFRALVMDYQEDVQTWHIDDQYLIGDRYLFAPLTAKSDTRKVYFPKGRWTRQGKEYGNGWETFTCGMEEYLLFEKAGE